MNDLIKIILSLALIGFAAQAADASEDDTSSTLVFGEFKIAGTGCYQPQGLPVPVVTDKEIRLPVATMVKRSAQEALKRGSCAFSLPLQLPSSHRLIVKSLKVRHHLNLAAGTAARARIEIFKTGAQGPVLSLNDQAGEHRRRHASQIESEIDLVTACGESLILRGNSSVTLQDGQGRSTARLDGYDLSYTLEECTP